jgi:hypothetical protein
MRAYLKHKETEKENIFMKLILGFLLVMGSFNTFAACSLDSACTSATDCTAAGTAAGKTATIVSGRCTASTSESSALPDCGAIVDSTAAKSTTTGGTTTPGTEDAVKK